MKAKNKKSGIALAVAEVTKPRPSELTQLQEPGRRRRAPEPPVHDDPLQELRRLVRMHKRWTNVAKSWEQSVSDRIDHETGETIKCTVPMPLRVDMMGVDLDGKGGAVKALRDEAGRLESAIKAQLKNVPIWNHFLKGVFGIGPIVGAYLVAMIRIERCPNVSQLIRYCGNACGENGKRESRKDGGGPKYAPDGERTPNGTGTYNDELKMRIWQGMTAMRKNAAKGPSTTKYLTRWDDAKHTVLTTLGRSTKTVKEGGVEKRKTLDENGKVIDGFAENKGRRKATDLFLWDYYVIARTLAGLPIRPDKYSAVRGRWHNGEEARDAFYTLTLEEALAMVGDVGARPVKPAIPIQRYVPPAMGAASTR